MYEPAVDAAPETLTLEMTTPLETSQTDLEFGRWRDVRFLLTMARALQPRAPPHSVSRIRSPSWLPQPRLLPPHRRLERSDFVLWNVAVRLPTRVNAGYRQENGRDLASTFTVRCADMTFVRSSSEQNKLGSFVAMAPHFRFAAVISSPNR